jgi:glycosyltransferase involved in cell wall biosynthesis
MKVLFCDPLNTQNIFYIHVKYLRRRGIDATLVIDSGGMLPRDHHPNWHDKTMAETSIPDWLYSMRFPFTLNPLSFLMRSVRLIAFLRKFDVIACSGYAPLWAVWAKRPFVFASYGSDLDQVAKQGWSGVSQGSLNIITKMFWALFKYYYVWSIRKAKAFLISPYQIKTAKSLGLKNLHFFSHIIDTDIIRPMGLRQRRHEKLKMRKKLNCDLILFHPTRQIWTDRAIADCKGNDQVFEAFARFLKEYRKRAKLIVVEKGWDVDASKKLVKELGIEDNVVWLSSMPRREMCRLYNVVDIVLDQFVVGVLALVSVEAMACGTPVLTYVGCSPKDMFYDEMPPILNVHRKRDIWHGMMRLAGSKKERDRLGKFGRKWVGENCVPDVTTEKFMELFRKAK